MSQKGQTLRIRPIPAYRELPRPVVARVEALEAYSHRPWHEHDWWQLSWAISGVLSLETRQGNFMAPPARAIWVPPHTSHQATNVAYTELRSLYVAPALMREAPLRCRVISIGPLVRELILAFSQLPEFYDEDAREGRLVRVMMDELLAAPEVGFNLPMPEDPRLARICESLQERPDDERTLAQWSGWVGLSERSLTRLFMQQTGMSFGDWRQRLRLLLALTALERGERVTHVALDAGYASPSAFIAAFRRNFGLTPTEMFRGAEKAPR